MIATRLWNKNQLLNDVRLLKLDDILPRVPKRRDCINRVSRKIDDIMSILTAPDEKKLHLLPKYVADNPDCFPSVRSFDGDMTFLNEKNK